MTDRTQQDSAEPDWSEAGCSRRTCSEQHTYKLGDCGLSQEEPEPETMMIGKRVMDVDGEWSI